MKKQRLENILNGLLVVLSGSDENHRDIIINKCRDNIHDLYSENKITTDIISNKLGYTDTKHLLQDCHKFDLTAKKCINLLCEMNDVDILFKNDIL